MNSPKLAVEFFDVKHDDMTAIKYCNMLSKYTIIDVDEQILTEWLELKWDYLPTHLLIFPALTVHIMNADKSACRLVTARRATIDILSDGDSEASD